LAINFAGRVGIGQVNPQRRAGASVCAEAIHDRRSMSHFHFLPQATMNALELKLPPPLLTLLIGTGMWLLSVLTPAFSWHLPYQRKVALLLVLAGAVCVVLGAATFRRAGTTVSPTRPQATSVLVRTGIYRFSRNPMYLGLSLALLGWSVVLGNSLSLGGVAVLVTYLNRFQIIPEERALTAKSGSDFAAYQRRVRRWL